MCDGVVIRMMTRQHFAKSPDFDDPQMRESPLDKLVLQVKHVGEYWIGFVVKYRSVRFL